MPTEGHAGPTPYYHMSFRMTAELRQRVVAAAYRANLSASRWASRALEEALQREEREIEQ